ncbi:MAG: regulatory protein RecX [Marinifilaceae bacterium]
MYYRKSKPQALDASEALARSQELCSRQEKCKSEIRKKLINWQIPEDQQDEILSSLEEDRFINESRYTEFFVKDKFRFNKWGRIKISYQLRMKEIPNTIISNALETISEKEYLETLEELLNQKRRSLKDQDVYQLKAKLLRFAQGRGFEPHLTLTLLEKVL